VVDGNVIRVLARLHARAGDARRGETARRLHADAGALLDRRRPGLSNEAVMELGQTVCLPRAPRCGECPLESGCAARAQGRPEAYPKRRATGKPRRERQEVFLVRSGARLLLVRRAAPGALRGLYVLPGADPAIRPGRRLAEVRHSIMDRRIRLLVREGTLERDLPAGARWVGLGRLGSVPCSSQVQKALRAAYGVTGTGRPSGPTAT
jgi:A/G-specific adenine glycosylase